MDEHHGSLEQERKWVEAAKKDSSHFRPLYEKYTDTVFRYFVRRTDDTSLSEELCSTTFFKALDKLESFQWQGKPFGAWLFRIAGNELRKHFRDKKPIYVIEEDKLDCLDLDEEELHDYIPELVKVLDDLDDFELRILELKFFEEQSFQQISELLEIGESAAKMRFYRLLDKLKQRIRRRHDEA